ERRWTAFDAEEPGERKDALDLVRRRELRQLDAQVELRGERAAVVEPGDLLRREPARKAQAARGGAGRREHDDVELVLAQLPPGGDPLAERGERRLARLQVLQLAVRDHGVDIRIAIEHRGVVAVDEGAEPGLGPRAPERREKRRGADE